MQGLLEIRGRPNHYSRGRISDRLASDRLTPNHQLIQDDYLLGGLPLEMQGRHAIQTKKRSLIFTYLSRNPELSSASREDAYKKFLDCLDPKVVERFDIGSRANRRAFYIYLEAYKDNPESRTVTGLLLADGEYERYFPEKEAELAND